jgi:predicted RecA/RadA family phage recombinase
MATNQIYKFSETMSLPVAVNTVSGSPVVVGGITGVALTDRAVDEDNLHGNPVGNATVAVHGTFLLALSDAGTGAIGAPVYVAAGTPATATLVATSNKLLGWLVSAKAAGANAKARVMLAGGHASQA